MHVFTHFKVSGDFSVTPTVTKCIEAEHSDRDIWFIHADAIEETPFLHLLPPRAINGEF